jgi:hypothetical protein
VKVKEELKQLRKDVESYENMNDGVPLAWSQPARTPHWETEVAAMTQTMLAMNLLPGYKVRAYPNARYDFFFDLNLTEQQNATYVEGVRVEDDQFDDTGALVLTDRWGEFKVDAESIVGDFEAEDGSSSKKYFDDVNLCVCWRVSSPTSSDFTIEVFDESTMMERQFPGTTHRITRAQGDHVVEVICLEDLASMMAEESQD